jgi:hypothetical protein
LFLIRHLVLPNGGCKLKHGVPSVSLLPVWLGHVANVNIPSTIVEWFLSSETLGLVWHWEIWNLTASSFSAHAATPY